MNKKMKKRMTRILTALLTVAVMVGFMPQMAAPTYAADEYPAIAIGAESVLKPTANTNDAQTVWYMNLPWRVISYDGAGNRYTDSKGAMSLLSSDILAEDQVFSDDWQADNANWYSGSPLQETVDGIYEELSTDKEKNLVMERVLKVDPFSTQYPYSTGVAGEETSGYLWPLSIAEAYDLPSNTFRSSVGDHWWLRSPGYQTYLAAEVRNDGVVKKDGYRVSFVNTVRPALNLNITPILFTSAAQNGKVTDEEGPDAMVPVEPNATDEWKLTLLDNGTVEGLDGHTGFQVSDIDRTKEDVTFNYSGAATGENEYISAIITSEPINDPAAEITYYGRIKNCVDSSDASGTLTINNVDKLRESDTLYVFNEQFNGDGTSDLAAQTDYASEVFEVCPRILYTVTFVDGIGHTLKQEQVVSGRSATAPADPTRQGFNFKGWDQDFSQITEDTTVTAVWEKRKASGTLLAKMKSKSSQKMVISWKKVEGVDGYDIFFSHCNKNNEKITPKKVKTIQGNSKFKWTKKDLKTHNTYKAQVKAYIMVDGNKEYVRTSPMIHACSTGSYGDYTNAKSVKVKEKNVSLAVGSTSKIKAKVKILKKSKKLLSKRHASKLRFLSSNTNVATVSKSGKITAVAPGSCQVYVYSVNGVYKTVKVTVY